MSLTMSDPVVYYNVKWKRTYIQSYKWTEFAKSSPFDPMKEKMKVVMSKGLDVDIKTISVPPPVIATGKVQNRRQRRPS